MTLYTCFEVGDSAMSIYNRSALKIMSAFATFFAPSGPNNKDPAKDESSESTGSLRQRVDTNHKGGLATLIRYVNMSRVSDRRSDNRIDVKIASGPLKLHHLFSKDEVLLKAGYAKLRTKLPPRFASFGSIPSDLGEFLTSVTSKIPANADAAIASLAAYIAVFARLMSRIQATTVVEPAFNLQFLEKQANDAVGQLYYYLEANSGRTAWGAYADC